MNAIGAIEDAIKSRFNTAQAAGALGYHPDLRTYAGEFSADIGRAVQRWPTLLIVYAGASLTKEARATFAMRHSFGVICMARSLRNEEEGRRGDGAEPGSYQLIDDTLALISGLVVFGEDKRPICTPLIPRAVRPLLNDRPDAQLLSIYAVDFDTELSHEMLPPTAELGDFNILHTNWDVPLFGNVSTELPADETADATDHTIINPAAPEAPPEEETEDEDD